MKNKYMIYLIIVILILVVVLSIKINKTENMETSANIINNINTTQTVKNDVYIESHKAYNYQIKGIVRNGTNKTITGLQISADIYDKNNNKIRSMKTFLESLSAGETWSFSVWTGETNYKYKNLKLIYNK